MLLFHHARTTVLLVGLRHERHARAFTVLNYQINFQHRLIVLGIVPCATELPVPPRCSLQLHLLYHRSCWIFRSIVKVTIQNGDYTSRHG